MCFGHHPELYQEFFRKGVPLEPIPIGWRRRRLPADHVIGVVLGMGTFRDRPIEDVLSKLYGVVKTTSST